MEGGAYYERKSKMAKSLTAIALNVVVMFAGEADARLETDGPSPALGVPPGFAETSTDEEQAEESNLFNRIFDETRAAQPECTCQVLRYVLHRPQSRPNRNAARRLSGRYSARLTGGRNREEVHKNLARSRRTQAWSKETVNDCVLNLRDNDACKHNGALSSFQNKRDISK